MTEVVIATRTKAVTNYRDLVAWQKAMQLVRLTYDLTSVLPAEERFGLASQMRRCAVSIPSNIAEGWGRHSTVDYVHFLRMSRGSAFELATQCEICEMLNYNGDWSSLMTSCDEKSAAFSRA